MALERRSISLTTTGPDGIVIDVEVSAPDDVHPDALRARLDVVMRHVVDVYGTGQPIDVAIGDVWLSGRALT